MTLQTLDAPPEAGPSDRLRTNVLALIEAEKRALRAGIRRPAPRSARSLRLLWRTGLQALAACALLSFGYLAGSHRAPSQPGPASPDPTGPVSPPQLRGRLDSMGLLVGYTLLQQQKELGK